MTRTTPELIPPLQTSAPHQREDCWPLCVIWHAMGPIHDGSSSRPSVGLVFEPGTLWSRSRDFIARPPRSQFFIDMDEKSFRNYQKRASM
ncbi:hypothetical protein AVEN_198043-1 [Araneus ventricosus]|uniref:Uncharacterized protein n=1 Tax=Araneus ventricosus TaxID=182803 RepID=A0A4Y2GP21_ARAVE|nr:hypothetical protein AVEN_198043-1 [Araneus ventricosus]